jgi:hypothetical protein
VGQTQKKISNQCHKYTTLTTSSNSHAHEKMEESCIPFLAELTVDWYHLLLMSLSIPIIWGEVLLQSQPCSFMAVMIKYRYTVHVYSHMLYHTICSALFFVVMLCSFLLSNIFPLIPIINELLCQSNIQIIIGTLKYTFSTHKIFLS